MPSATPIPLPPVKGTSKSKSASKLAKPAKAAPVKKKPALSEEMVIDSSDEDAEEPALKKIVNGTSAKIAAPSSDSSSEESDSESESSPESETVTKPATPVAKKATSSNSKQQTPKPTKEAQAEPPVATVPTEVRDAVRETHSTQELRPAKPYKAPAGYKNASDAARSGNAKLLDRSALSGKQLWYLSAPSTVDLSKLEELTAQQLNGKVPVFKQDDGEYTLQKEPIGTTAEVQIMLPDGQHFAAAPTQILASYKLQHRVTIPSSTAGPTSHHAYAKPKRQQPAGMRTRWRPAGAMNSDAEDSDGAAVTTARSAQSSTAAQAVSQPEPESSAPVSTASLTKKRKDREVGDSERKKEKKHKKEERKQAEAAGTAIDADAMDIDPAPVEKNRFERSTPELIQIRDSLAGLQSQNEPALTEKKKKKKKQKDPLREAAEAELPADVEDSKPKTNGKTPIPVPALPISEPQAEKKKKKDKDKDKGKDKVKVKKEPRVERRTEIVM